MPNNPNQPSTTKPSNQDRDEKRIPRESERDIAREAGRPREEHDRQNRGSTGDTVRDAAGRSDQQDRMNPRDENQLDDKNPTSVEQDEMETERSNSASDRDRPRNPGQPVR